MEPAKKRIDAIDALRGLAVILMVIHHFFRDLIDLCGAPEWLFTNWVFTPLHYVFAGTFVFLAGVSSNFSRNNLARGVKCFALALAMTFVTSLPVINAPIRFGVLHLLGICMIFYALSQKLLDKIPRKIQPFLYTGLIVLTVVLIYGPDEEILIRFYKTLTPEQEAFWGDAAQYLYIFGFPAADFWSADYFPLFPWLFLFLLGTWAGGYVKERRLPKAFYDFTCPVLPAVGRHALLVYVLHQPVMYGAILLWQTLTSF